MKEDFRIKLLLKLAEIQRTSAPIEISIGSLTASQMVENDTLIIKSAPPIVTKELIEAGYTLSITPEGVKVYDYKGA